MHFTLLRVGFFSRYAEKLLMSKSLTSLHLIEQFYSSAQSTDLYQQLMAAHRWPDNHYRYAGREFILPRLQTWHADPGIRYSYSNNLLLTQSWTPLLNSIRQKIERYLEVSFNSVLVNYYRDGQDYVGWHSDNEVELGPQPFIASLTLGATRRFAFKHKQTHEEQFMPLKAGALLVMQADFQHYYWHSLPPDALITSGRVNMTFRQVLLKDE
jgi:alkylated DNA repair dioxygenase AlkB